MVNDRTIVQWTAVIALVLAGVLAGAASTPATAQTGQRCFPETGFCISGRIREFWEQNGGLPVFGYPIGPAYLTTVEGRELQVQWFERHRFELHLENQRPYDVLLGRLGADNLSLQGRDWFSFPAGQPQAGCRFFAETGHNVCGAFLTSWRSNGLELDGRSGTSETESLALFGLPLGDAQTETLADGRQYTVQWFERARFEDHGELGVLFGLLGRDLMNSGAPGTAPINGAGPPVPPPDEVSARLRVPQGFQVRGFASGLDGPRLMTIGPDGALYVAERQAGRVIRLPDRNHDGLADGVETVVGQLSAPHNLEWIDGCMYVAENDEVSRHCDADGDGALEQRARIVELPTGGAHTSRTLHQGPDGKLYVAAGSSCNVCSEQDPRRAAILRFNLDGSIPGDNPFANDPDPRRRAVWADGLRNSIDFLFTPDGRLWANHNGRDNMIDAQTKNDKPLEELIIDVQGGRHHGWPFCTSERADGRLEPGPGPYVEIPDPTADVPPAPGGFRCADAVPAQFTVEAHAAPIGMARYDRLEFGGDYQGNLFVALHGSWNRIPPAACRVVRLQVIDGQPASVEDFLTGFQDNLGGHCREAWGRPAGVVVGPAGELYVSDDKNGRVYRIVREG